MKIILTLFISSLVFNAIAQNSGQHLQNNTVTTAFPFLMYAPDARSGGLGEVGAALSPSANSFHWNTANIGFSEDKAATDVLLL